MTMPPGRTASTAAAEAAKSKVRRRVGLLLLLGGLGLIVGGLFLPWLTRACTAQCGTPGFTWSEGLGPLTYGANGNPVASPCSWPYWVFVGAVGLLLVWQEILPVARRRAAPALGLAGLFLFGAVVTFLTLTLSTVGFGPPSGPVMSTSLAPGCAVGPLGALLFAVGGWLRYHPMRPAPPAGEIPGIPPGQ